MAQVKPFNCCTDERSFSLLGFQSFTPFGVRQMASVFHGLSLSLFLSLFLLLASGGWKEENFLGNEFDNRSSCQCLTLTPKALYFTPITRPQSATKLVETPVAIILGASCRLAPRTNDWMVFLALLSFLRFLFLGYS